MARLIVLRQTRVECGQRNQAVQSAAVEKVPAKPVRDPAPDRALSRPAGPVDRHHENRLGASSVIRDLAQSHISSS